MAGNLAYQYLIDIKTLPNFMISNICMEVCGYRMYNCRLNNDFETKDDIIVLIRKKALNANDQIAIRKISGELYIGYEVEEQ